jgi:arsenite-transporting ATPase
VGKTTLASATALRLAAAYPEKRVHLISTDPARSLSDCLELPLGPQGTRVAGRLTAMEIDAEAEFAVLREQYAVEVTEFFDRLLADQGLVDLEFEREALERMLDLVPPGLDELMALARVVALLEPGRDDLLVLDTAPTGHFVRLLELPGLIQDWLHVMFGILLKYKRVFWLPRTFDFLLATSKKVRRLRALLADGLASRLHVVSIPTEMALEETRDLVQACGRVGVRVPHLFLNQASPPGRCPACLDRSEAESRVRRRFNEAFPDIPQSVVYWCGERRGVARLSELGEALYVA